MRRPKAQENPAECHIDSRGNPRTWATADSRNKIGLLFHSQVIFQKRRSQVYPKRQPRWRGTLENVTEQEHLPWREHIGSPQKRLPKHDIKGLTPYQILGKLTSQTKKERFEVCWKEGAEMTSQQWQQQESYPFSMGRTYVRQSSAMSLRRECVHVDAFTQQDRERRCIIAVSCWILRTWKFNKNFVDLCHEDFEKANAEKQCTSQSFRHWIRTPTRSTSLTSTWRTIMTDWLWWIWKQRRIRWDSIRQRTGVSCATTQFRPSSPQRSSTSKTNPERFGKEEYKEEQLSPKKKSRYDHGQPRETSSQNTEQETIEAGQLRAISCTAEIIKENRSNEVYTQCTCCSKRSRWWTDFSRCGKKLGGWTAVHEKNAQVTDENGCQFIQSLVQLRIAEQVQRSQHHGTSKDQIFWTMMRDHFRRCTKSPTQSPNNRSISKAELIAGIKRSIHESHVHQRTFKKKELQNWERSKEKRTRWSCRKPTITSITWTDTFRKPEN